MIALGVPSGVFWVQGGGLGAKLYWSQNGHKAKVLGLLGFLKIYVGSICWEDMQFRFPGVTMGILGAWRGVQSV